MKLRDFNGPLRSAATIWALLALGGCAVQDPNETRVSGTWEEIDTQSFRVSHGTAWRYGNGPVTIAASPDAVLIEALASDPDPQSDAVWMAEGLGAQLLLHEADNNPTYPAGKTTIAGPHSMGTQSSDSTLDLDLSENRARGRLVNDYIKLEFNVPLRVLPPTPPKSDHWATVGDEFWVGHYTRLYASIQAGDTSEALRLMGLPTASAQLLAADKRIYTMLKRLHDYCPDPTQLIKEPGYPGEIIGLSRRGEHGVFRGYVWFHGGDDLEIPTFLNCSITERDGESIEQCLAMQKDCAPALVEANAH